MIVRESIFAPKSTKEILKNIDNQYPDEFGKMMKNIMQRDDMFDIGISQVTDLSFTFGVYSNDPNQVRWYAIQKLKEHPLMMKKWFKADISLYKRIYDNDNGVYDWAMQPERHSLKFKNINELNKIIAQFKKEI